MKITSKGQVTIPKAYRTRFGFLPNTEVEFVPDKDGLCLIKTDEKFAKGRRLIEHMKGRGGGKLSTAEIMKLTRGQAC